jgi:hypothetical protein
MRRITQRDQVLFCVIPEQASRPEGGEPQDSAAIRISGSAMRRAAKPSVGVRSTTPARAARGVVFAES